jgi:hypothetical protein
MLRARATASRAASHASGTFYSTNCPGCPAATAGKGASRQGVQGRVSHSDNGRTCLKRQAAAHGSPFPRSTTKRVQRAQDGRDTYESVQAGCCGGYRPERRVQRADVIIRLAPPIWRRLYRVLRREGLQIEPLRWTLRYDKVFGTKDVLALQNGRATATCIEIRSNRDMQRLLQLGIECF